MPSLMVQGCSSWSGKSLLTAALARSYSRRGLKVAPFKAMNMANNARVAEGGEMASAQYLQALAARTVPDVRMNPVLVKPETWSSSQVVVLGRVDPALSGAPWRGRAASLWPSVEASYGSLKAGFDLILIEGAGSPAEINLWDVDVANMRMAELADAPVVLVVDIDRGGAFAHLYGTWALLPDEQRSRIVGFVLNRFRGDQSLLAPAPDRLRDLTGVPVVGVLPMLEHGLPDEDGAAPQEWKGTDAPKLAVVCYPTASNLDEFKPLGGAVNLRWARSVVEIDGADLVILPGSKHVSGDLEWLKSRGFAQALAARAGSGGRILGICGGLQMLGERMDDPTGIDGSGDGLGLLPLRTCFEAEKRTARVTVTFSLLPNPWTALSGKAFAGFEIRHGRSTANGQADEVLSEGRGFVRGPVLGIYVHGLFEEPQTAAAVVGVPVPAVLEETFEALADAVEEHLDLRAIDAALGLL